MLYLRRACARTCSRRFITGLNSNADWWWVDDSLAVGKEVPTRLAVLLLYLEVCDLHLCTPLTDKRSHKSFTLTDLQQASSFDLSNMVTLSACSCPRRLSALDLRVRATLFPSPDHTCLYIPRICSDADQRETTLQDVPDNNHQSHRIPFQAKQLSDASWIQTND